MKIQEAFEDIILWMLQAHEELGSFYVVKFNVSSTKLTHMLIF